MMVSNVTGSGAMALLQLDDASTSAGRITGEHERGQGRWSQTADALAMMAGGGDACASPMAASCACHHEYLFYDSFERLLLGVFAQPLFLFGLCANIASVYIFTHRCMVDSPINWYLACLSASDSLILLSSYFVLALPRLGEALFLWSANYVSYVTAPYFYGLMLLTQTVSVYMTVGVSLHRFIGVCIPYRASVLLTRRRVRLFIACILLLSAVFNITRFFEVYQANTCYRDNIDYYIPVIRPTSLRLNATYRNIFFGWAYTLVMFVVPFALLIFLNSHVLRAVRRSRRMHNMAGGEETDELCKKAERKERQTSIMLVTVVITFIMCNSLAFVVNILENIGVVGPLYSYLVAFNNLLVVINASSNVFIYCLFSDKYRLLLRHLIPGCGRQSGARRLLSMDATSTMLTKA